MKATGQKKSAPGIVSRLPQSPSNRNWKLGARPQRLTATEATTSIQTGRRTPCPGFRHGTVRRSARSLYSVSGAGQFVRNPGGSKTQSATVFPVSGNPARTTSNTIPFFGIPKAVPRVLRLRRAWKTRNRILGAGNLLSQSLSTAILSSGVRNDAPARTTLFRHLQKENPDGKSGRKSRLTSRFHPSRVGMFHFPGSYHGLQFFLRLLSPLKARKRISGARRLSLECQLRRLIAKGRLPFRGFQARSHRCPESTLASCRIPPRATPHLARDTTELSKKTASKIYLRSPLTLRKHRFGAGLAFPEVNPVWTVSLHCVAQAGLKTRTILFQPLQGIKPTGKSGWNLRLVPRFHPSRVGVFHFPGSHHRRHPFLRLSPFLTLRKHPLGAGLPVLMVSLVWILLLHSAVQAAGPETRITNTPTAAYEPPAHTAVEPGHETPRTTSDLLRFIRALEAPRGYTDYERRIRIPPPRPLTAMTVGEVLNWQVRVRRSGAPSTAAGGYQIIYPTLKRLVTKYEVSRTLRFDARLQDHLARLLIGECGQPGPRRNHPRYGNCLAGIWAALPLTHGPNRGRSAYHGVAGNRALTHPDTVLDLLAGLPVDIASHGTPQPVDTAQALTRIGNSISTRSLAFGARRITLQTEDINAALRKARRNNTLTPPLKPAMKTWKQDPYAQN